MIEDLKELETLVRKVSNSANVAVMTEPSQPGFRIQIEHGPSEFQVDGPPYFDRFPVTVQFRDQKKNWETVLRTCLGVKKKILETKNFKWTLGATEKPSTEASGEYALVLNLWIDHRY